MNVENKQGLTISARRIRDNGLPVPRRVDVANDSGIDLYLDLALAQAGGPAALYNHSIIRGDIRIFNADKLVDVALEVRPDAIVWVRTGWALAIPQGFEGHVRGRSGLAFKHGVTVWHTGTVDAGFRGEILVALWNASSTPYTFKHGDRIAQLVVSASPSPLQVEEVAGLSESARGDNGFGSSGR